MTREDMVRLFARRDEAFRRLDADALAADHADDAIAESPMLGIIMGREKIAEVYDAWFMAFPDLEFTPQHLLIDGNRAAQFFRVTGTQSKMFGGVPATGRRVEFKGCWLFTIGDDVAS